MLRERVGAAGRAVGRGRAAGRGAGARLAPAADGRGRWAGEVAGLGPGGDYAFSLDGGPPRPDPRSASQPYGPDGPSRVVDHAAFAWSDAGWRRRRPAQRRPLRAARRHVLARGDLRRGHRPARPPGRPGRRRRRAAAGRRVLRRAGVGLRRRRPVGPAPRLRRARRPQAPGRRLPRPRARRGGRRRLQPPGAVGEPPRPSSGRTSATATTRTGARPSTSTGGAATRCGPSSSRTPACGCATTTPTGCGSTPCTPSSTTPPSTCSSRCRSPVRALAAQVGRPLWLVAESDRNDPRYVRPPEVGGYGLDASWADEWHHALHAVLTGERAGYYADFGTLAQLAKALRQAWVYDGAYSPERDRTHGRSPAGLPGSAFVVSAQNHDQVGNRAAGDRLGASRVAAGGCGWRPRFLLTAPFVPLLFQGEEWGASIAVPVLHQPPRPRAGPGGLGGPAAASSPTSAGSPADVPDPQDPATFRRSKLRLGRGGLGRARRPAGLVPGADRPAAVAPDAGLRAGRVAHGRRRRGGRVAVRASGARSRWRPTSAVVVRAAAAGAAAGGELVLASDGGVALDGAGLALPPDSVAVVALWARRLTAACLACAAPCRSRRVAYARAGPPSLSHPVLRVAAVATGAVVRGSRVVASNGRRRAPTATSNFGVSRRENHDASAFYDRFTPPATSDDETVLAPAPVADPIRVADARHMADLPDGSVALVVTSPPYFAGQAVRGGAVPRGHPRLLRRVPRPAARGVPRVRPGARAGRPHRGQRGQPRAASPTGRCRPTSSRSCRTTSACCCGARSCGRRRRGPGATAPGARSARPPTPRCATSPSGWSSPARAASTGR